MAVQTTWESPDFVREHLKELRYFNTAGPCNREEHYMIEAASRLRGVERLIDMKQYFVIHAARQSGKTTYLKDLTQRINEGGKYHAIYCSLESLDRIEDAEKGIPQIISCISEALFNAKIPFCEEFAKNANFFFFATVLNSSLTRYCAILDKPLIILFDEIDCLRENALISFLRQMRLGYNNRSTNPFVQSVALVGLRNIRDYKVQIRPDSESLGSASPFNIVTETYTLKNFTKEEITTLYQQHTDEAGQIFEEEAINLVFERTQGQPWLVNAVAREVIVKILQYDHTKPVTAALVDEAIQTIILRRDSHIDSLLERLKEERVRRVIEPIINGDDFFDRLSDDYLYVIDLGLIKSIEGKIQPANSIYGEVISRTLTYDAQEKFLLKKPDATVPRYLKDGKIDMDYLFKDFQQFWRENSDIWIERFQYKEAAPHLILQAFLQRIFNGGGDIKREMAAGTGRSDLCIVYDGKKYPIELKINRGEKYIRQGIEQTLYYMDVLGCIEGWLVIFDRRPNVGWEEKIYIKKEVVAGKTLTIIGL